MPPRNRNGPGQRRPARLRAVLYGRQSMYDEASISLELQEHANREHCTRHDLDVIAALEDEGISGRRWENRPGAVEAMRMIEAREADVIVVWKWSRLSRRRLDLAVAFDRAETAGGRIDSSTEPVDTRTASGRLARGMLGEIAAFESERIGEGWRETHGSRRARGVPHAGGDRYGYRREGGEYVIDEGDLEADPPRHSPAEALRLAYRWFVDGWGANRIVRELNRRGYRNRIGEPFKRHGLYPLLDAGFAAGLIVHRERDTRGNVVGDPTYHPGAHPPIIDADLWSAYLATRRARGGTPPAAAGSRHPLGGLMRCGDCGSNMTAYSTPGPARSSTPPTYACNAWRRLGSEWRRCVTVTRPRAERVVREWLEGIAADVEAAAAADRKVRRRHRDARAEADRAGREVTRIEGELARLAVMRARDEIAAAGYDEARATLEADLESAASRAEEAELAALRRPAASRSTAGRLLEAWDLLPGEDLRTGLRTLIRSVWVFPPEARGYPSRLEVVPVWEADPEVVAPPMPDAPADRHPPSDGPAADE